MRSYFHVTDADALTVPCPKCEQAKGEGCVYVPVYTTGQYLRSAKSIQRQTLVGTPTKKPHNDRRNAVHQRLAAKRRLEARKQRSVPSEQIARLLAAYRAGADWDRRENLRLYTWLRLYSSVLTSPPVRAPDSFECQHGVHRADACRECGQ